MNLNSLSTRTKKILGSAAAIGIIFIGALFIYAVLVGPSKQPYRDALAQYKNVYNANVAFTNNGAAINATQATDEEFSKNIEVVNASLDNLKTENEALAKEEVLADGEGKSLYEAFDKKLQQYLAYNHDVIASIEMLRPVLYVCSAKMSAIEESLAAAMEIRSCATSMGDLRNVPDRDYAALVKSFERIYSALASNIEATAKLADPEGADKAAHDTVLSEREALLKDLTQVSATLSKSLQEHRNEVDITADAMALDKYLDKNSSVF